MNNNCNTRRTERFGVGARAGSPANEEVASITTDTLQEPRTTGGREVIVLLATSAVVLALAVVSQSLLAYTLLPEGRGAYAICVLFGSLAGIIAGPASDRGAQYFVMAQQISVSQATSVAFTVCLIGSAIAAGVAFPLIHSNLSFFQNADTGSFQLALLLIPLFSLSAVTELQLAGLRRFSRLAVFSILRSVVVVLTIVVLVWGLDFGVNGALMSVALGYLVMIVIGVADLRRHCGLTFELASRAAFRGIIGYGLKEYVAKVGFAFDPRVGGLLLGMVAGRADIGLFTAGSAIVTRIFALPNSVSTYLLPRVARDGRGRPELVAFCARVAWWATGGVLLAWFAVSTPLVPILFSEAFVPVVKLTWIMSIGIFAYAGAHVFVAYFRGTNRPQICSWAMWLGLSANIILFFALYSKLGIEGAAWAMTGGLVFRSLYLTVMFRKATRLPLTSTLLLVPRDVAYLWASGRALISGKI